MKLLHTADLHIGKTLYRKNRDHEHEQLFSWLIKIICENNIDLLILAGDIFDSPFPRLKSQNMYYNFLSELQHTPCKNIIVVAGNHDSGVFLTTTKSVLKKLNIHLIGNISESLDDEIIPLYHNNKLEAIICAVPYLREKDISKIFAGEDITEHTAKICYGITDHYHRICEQALQLRNQNHANIPIIATGHLYTAGENKGEGEGVRELYLGNSARVPVSIFPDYLDYVALGHLHIPQYVGGKEHIRYSGSPLSLGFGEKHKDKSVVLVEWCEQNTPPTITTLAVPRYQRLESIIGNWEYICSQIARLDADAENIWLEIEYTGKENINNLYQKLQDLVQNTQLEVLRVKNSQKTCAQLRNNHEVINLAEMTPKDVFLRLLENKQIAQDKKEQLMYAFQEIDTQIFADEHDQFRIAEN